MAKKPRFLAAWPGGAGIRRHAQPAPTAAVRRSVHGEADHVLAGEAVLALWLQI